MKDIELKKMAEVEEKAFSKEQLLKYANDIGKLYEEERSQRKALERANAELQREILERTRLQDELRRSERAYRSLFEESQEAIFITTREGTLVDANNAFLKLVGYERKELVGSSILKTYEDPSVRTLVIQLVEENDGLKDFEIRLRRKDGIVCECVLACSVRRGPNGSILGYQGIIRDVTAQERVRRTLELARRMEALAHMAGGIAHEIRNPLAISSSAAQLLQNAQLAPDLVETCVGKVLSGIHRASLIIENLLVFAKPLTDYTLTHVNVAELIAVTMEELSSRATKQRIEIISKLDSERLFLSGNPELLHRAFLNLFLNGFAAMPQGGSLAVTAGRKDLEVTVNVTDSGKGMSKEQCDRAFDPFYHDHPAKGGIGLGLSVAYSIVRDHGGTIQVESRLGEGSTFLVTLPLSDPE
ncbi:MAG: PAS domain S-box protein [Desulfomonilaceae bacterium]|nr:PAS domain S-box protein [Desulfomonilaceae bacterium]